MKVILFVKIICKRSFYFSFTCSPTCDYELKRSSIKKLEVIGEGQFGDVCSGLYYFDQDKDPIEVAIKTCKDDGDSSMSEKFLEEACEYFRCLN